MTMTTMTTYSLHRHRLHPPENEYSFHATHVVQLFIVSYYLVFLAIIIKLTERGYINLVINNNLFRFYRIQVQRILPR